MLSSPVGESVSEIPEGIMKHCVYLNSSHSLILRLQRLQDSMVTDKFFKTGLES
jgi:hypothetical protein